jgi:xylulokinase
MSTLQTLSSNSIITGWDFSTGAVKCLAFDLSGNVIAESRYPTDLWTADGVSELNLMMLEGQARASTRAVADQLRAKGRLNDWVAGGISATHHTAGRIDRQGNQIRRAICWNDQTLSTYHAKGMKRLGGAKKVQKLIGGPWAERYSLSHLVKDEETLSSDDWKKTAYIAQHGSIAAGYLTGVFNVVSVSAAASTGLMDLRSNEWSKGMLSALASGKNRKMVWETLPTIHKSMSEPIGPLADHIAVECGLALDHRPLIFPTLDDQAAGLVGGGAVDDGQVAIILGNSAVVNSSASEAPKTAKLDAMKVNWGPYLWMRCYSNGAQFLDHVLGAKPEWKKLEKAARAIAPGCGGVSVLPFLLSEPSVGVSEPNVKWFPKEPRDEGVRFRAALEAIAYLIALGVEAHEKSGQQIRSISVSGGIARSPLMCEILASVLGKPLTRLKSEEGTALGAAVVALMGVENYRRQFQGIGEPYTVADAVAYLVQYRDGAEPNAAWQPVYAKGLETFRGRM